MHVSYKWMARSGYRDDNRMLWCSFDYLVYKVLMKWKIRYSDYGFIGKNFENDSRTFSFPEYRNWPEIGLICKLHTTMRNDTQPVMSHCILMSFKWPHWCKSGRRENAHHPSLLQRCTSDITLYNEFWKIRLQEQETLLKSLGKCL